MKKYIYLNNIDTSNKIVNILTQLIPELKSNVFNKYIDIDFLKNNREYYKYNLIICNFIIRPHKDTFDLFDVVNTNINFYSLIFIFKNLLKDGNAIINIDNIKIYIENHKNLKKLIKKPAKHILGVLKGGISDRLGRQVLTNGDIIRIATIKKLASKFTIKKNLVTLIIKN